MDGVIAFGQGACHIGGAKSLRGGSGQGIKQQEIMLQIRIAGPRRGVQKRP